MTDDDNYDNYINLMTTYYVLQTFNRTKYIYSYCAYMINTHNMLSKGTYIASLK